MYCKNNANMSSRGVSFRTLCAAAQLMLRCSCVIGGTLSGCSIRCCRGKCLYPGRVCCTSGIPGHPQLEPRCSQRTAHPGESCRSLSEGCYCTWPPAVSAEGCGSKALPPGLPHTWPRCQFGAPWPRWLSCLPSPPSSGSTIMFR